LQPIII